MSGSFAMTAAWGLLVLAAFIGWGGAIAARLFGDRRVDLGLRAAWGMAFAILFGGTCCLFGIASRGMVFTFVAVGVGLGLALWLRRRPDWHFDLRGGMTYWKNRPGSALLLMLCAVAIALQYLGSIWNTRFNPNDDFIAYFPFAKQILSQGTLYDPFNLRRALSWGGQSVLHAMVLAGTPGFRLHLFDQGICLVIVALLVIGDRKTDRIPLASILALLVLVTLPDIRGNTYPQMSAVVVFYLLYRTLAWLDDGAERNAFACAAIVALSATAACTLRANYIAVAVPMVAISYAHDAWKVGVTRVREAGVVAALSFLFLLPWMVLSYRSAGTPLFPLFLGNYNTAFPMLQRAGDWRQQLSDLRRTVFGVRIFLPLLPVIVGGFLLPDRAPRKALHALLLSSAIGWLLLVHTVATDIPSFERYVFGFQVAAVLAVMARISIAPGEAGLARQWRLRMAAAIATVGVFAQLILVGPNSIDEHWFVARRIALLARVPLRSAESSPRAETYRQLQESIPADERLLVMVDFPFLFDFSRNEISNMDCVAALSPRPGFPYFRGPAAVADYLRGQSIRYFAYVKPEQAFALYRRDVWERQLVEPNPIWRAQAPVYLDVFNNVAALSSSHRHVYEDDSLVLLDLGQPQKAKGPQSWETEGQSEK